MQLNLPKNKTQTRIVGRAQVKVKEDNDAPIKKKYSNGSDKWPNGHQLTLSAFGWPEINWCL